MLMSRSMFRPLAPFTGATRCILLMTGLALAAAATALAQTAPPVLDHFNCYFTNNPVQPVAIGLQDQFDAAGASDTVADLRLIRLCNPVQKTLASGAVTPIQNPAAHLALYLITPEPIIPRRVIVRNQFGFFQTLSVRNAVALAVPSGKALNTAAAPPPPPPIPTGLDHFKCYLAGGEPINRVVSLTDQFQTELVRVLEPILFCNPVQKTLLATAGPPIVTPITNPLGHLTCYVETPRPFQASVVITNQFVPAGTVFPMIVGQSDILCVPSFKLRWTPILPPSSFSAAGFDDEN